MNRVMIVRWSGAAAVIGGGLAILGAFLAQPFPGMYMLTGLLTLVGLVGVLMLLRMKGAGGWGWAGIGTAFVGNVFFAIERFYALAGIMYGLGLILLAIGAWRSGAFPRWMPALWVLAPLIGVPGLILPDAAEVLTILATIVFGLAFIGAGYVLWNQGSALTAQGRP